ncbi:hypothetical protein V6N13_104380 [Hibiscus sabdariffa]
MFLFIHAILVSPTGWANAATIDIIYDLLHMMGRDDIPVGLGDVFAMNQSDKVLPLVGDCKLYKLQQTDQRYHHMEIFLGEILGAIFMAEDYHNLKPTIEEMPIKIIVEGVESVDGQILIDKKQGTTDISNKSHVRQCDFLSGDLIAGQK